MSKTSAFDEMHGMEGACRDQYRLVEAWLQRTERQVLEEKKRQAELLFRRIGITFAVYGEESDPERLIPFDLIPRVLDADEWDFLACGLEQRVRALNHFLHDVYHGREIIRAGIIPARLILHNESFLAEMQDLDLPHGVYSHIAGIDMIRTDAGQFFVLEDNCRTPSGVSYMLENREVMMRMFPDIFEGHAIQPIGHYAEELLECLKSVAPANCEGPPEIAVLTPGAFNSAYYEHSFLADEMGVELVEAADLVVEETTVYMRTTGGPKRVDVIYRRVDDAYLDPLVFRPDSLLGVPGIFYAMKAGNLTIANAPGSGIADDKAVYTHVPDMIRFYLGEQPLLANVPTWCCGEAESLAHVLDHLDEFVVKAVHGSGGYGMLVGPQASRAQLEEFRHRIEAEPEAYIAQPTLALSTCPTFVEGGIAPRHVDLRPFVLCGRDVRIVPGGLTRVALREGSLVVNSSQGGGTKDTWVLQPEAGQRQSQWGTGQSQTQGGQGPRWQRQRQD